MGLLSPGNIEKPKLSTVTKGGRALLIKQLLSIGFTSLTIAGCHPIGRLAAPSVTTSKLKACTGESTVGHDRAMSLQAVVNVTLPADFDPGKPHATITVNPSHEDPYLFDNRADDETGRIVKGPRGYGDPLDVWISGLGVKPPGFIAIKLIKPKEANYDFFVEPVTGIIGVGAGSAIGADILCGGRPILPKMAPSDARQYVVFYVNLDRMPPPRPKPLPPSASSIFPKFNIVLRLGKPPGALHFIDPKVRNDGKQIH